MPGNQQLLLLLMRAFAQPRLLKGDDSTPIGDWVRRLIPLRRLVVIDLDVLSNLLAYENSLTLIVYEISALKVMT